MITSYHQCRYGLVVPPSFFSLLLVRRLVSVFLKSGNVGIWMHRCPLSQLASDQSMLFVTSIYVKIPTPEVLVWREIASFRPPVRQTAQVQHIVSLLFHSCEQEKVTNHNACPQKPESRARRRPAAAHQQQSPLGAGPARQGARGRVRAEPPGRRGSRRMAGSAVF